jgi:hypothetical protein
MMDCANALLMAESSLSYLCQSPLFIYSIYYF